MPTDTVDLTPIADQFRQALSHLWTGVLQGFGSEGPSRPALDALVGIEDEMFGLMVLCPIGRESSLRDYRRIPLPYLTIEARGPQDLIGQKGLLGKSGNFEWREPERVALRTLGSVQFVEFFDWNVYRDPSFPLVKAFVPGAQQDPPRTQSYVLLPWEEVLLKGRVLKGVDEEN
jgi:hypothetical protein